MIVCVIFVDPALLKRTKLFRQPSGSDEGADAITLHSSQKWLGAGSIRSSAALPRMAVRGRAFLSEHTDYNRDRYYKGRVSNRFETRPGATSADQEVAGPIE
jgi:hypothetical protein